MRRHRRPVLLLALLGVGLTVYGCGTEGADPGGGTAAQTPTSGAAAEEVVGIGIVMQRSAEEPPEFCVGPVAESMPPQCRGPVLAGEFSWEDVEARQQGEVRWTDETYYGVGTYAPDGGEQGTFTLTRPLTTEQPQGYPPLRPAEG
ncbi:hypothetical protein AVL62_12080 [Serinicoccus chungangensis]|uniref:Lipoprotein n=1 Tax=Serinicoccus chungangensis TaxID=767452 RepID=A0A0W8IAR4_9MICO|nr:hypothetical protein [Serinicoccus chungangensis]KUG56861.1 hypothetical protein AVL62_12080 [Serinicoccus chungangensis]